jgi:hypothetical protein
VSTVESTFEIWDGTPAGGILTTVRPAQTVVQLRGEIDLCMAAELEGLLNTLPTATSELVLDVEGLTFCDSTLADFIDVMLRHMPVTVVHTNRWVTEFLTLVDLADRVPTVKGAM